MDTAGIKAWNHYHIDNTNVENTKTTNTYTRVSDWSFTKQLNAKIVAGMNGLRSIYFIFFVYF